MRSKKLSPGRAVTSITIRSDSTRVPPVTPERSVPASRTTGADSPVIADSSTVAAPFDHLAVGGITSPALTTTTISGEQGRRGHPLLFSRGGEASGRSCRIVWRAGRWPGPGLGPRR
jgi:hypothetical protein